MVLSSRRALVIDLGLEQTKYFKQGYDSLVVVVDI